MTFPSAQLDKFMLRLPAGMRDELKVAAAANGRSVNAEIIIRLGGVPEISPRVSRLQAAAPAGLRDEFAKEALRGIISDCGLSADEMADRCYEVADAMMARRTRGGE